MVNQTSSQKAASAYTRRAFAGTTRYLGSSKPPSGGGGGGISKPKTPTTSSRVIYDPKTGKVVTKITVVGTQVTVTDVGTGKVTRYKTDKPIHASEFTETKSPVTTGDVTIQQKGIRSYAEQRKEQLDTKRTVFKKTGVFEGTLAEAQASGFLGKTFISPETMKRSGSPTISITEKTTPQEFKMQRDVALGGVGKTVSVGITTPPKSVKTGIIDDDGYDYGVLASKTGMTSSMYPLPPSPKEQFISGYERRVLGLKKREERLETFTQKLDLEFPTGIQAWKPRELIKLPGRFAFALASMPVVYGGRISLFTESLFRKKGREELGEAFQETISFKKPSGKLKVPGMITQMDFKQPETYVGIALLATGVRTGAKARTQKMLFKETELVGEQYMGIKCTPTKVKSDILYQTEKFEYVKPEHYPSSFYIQEVPTPTVAIAKSIGGKSKVTSVMIGGKQFTTISRKIMETQYRARIESYKGITKTKIYEQKPVVGSEIPIEKLIKKYTRKTEPSIVFTEEIRVGKKLQAIFEPGRTILSKPEFRVETKRKGVFQKGISAIEKGKQPIGEISTIYSQKLLTKTVQPKIRVTTGQPIMDLDLGMVVPEYVTLEIFKTKYKYVDFPPKPKTASLIKAGKTLYKETPTVSATFQQLSAKQRFFIGFEKKYIKPTTRKVSKEFTEFVSKPIVEDFIGIKKEFGGFKGDVGNIMKEMVGKYKRQGIRTQVLERTEVVEIPRPTTKMDMLSELEYTTPKPIAVSKVVPVTIPKLESRLIPSVKTTTKTVSKSKTKPTSKMITKPMIKQVPKTKPISKVLIKPLIKQVPKTKSITVPITKPVMKQLSKQKQIQKQLTKQVTKMMEIRPSTTIGRKISYSFFPEEPIIPKIYGLPSSRLPKLTKRKKKKLKITRKTKYQPSLAGIEYKIKGGKPDVLTGIGVRPLIG